MWGGNVVAGKLAVGEVSPMMVTFLRWFISFGTLAVVAREPIRAEWRLLLPAWRYVLLMATIGFTGFNALFYEAAHYTTAVNIAIIQGSTPIFILIGAVLFFRGKVGPLQAVGVAMTLFGVVLTASHGDPAFWPRCRSTGATCGCWSPASSTPPTRSSFASAPRRLASSSSPRWLWRPASPPCHSCWRRRPLGSCNGRP